MLLDQAPGPPVGSRRAVVVEVEAEMSQIMCLIQSLALSTPSTQQSGSASSHTAQLSLWGSLMLVRCHGEVSQGRVATI